MPHPVNSNTESTAVTAVGALLRDNALSRLETSVLLAHVLGCARAAVLAHADRKLDGAEARRFAELRQRRIQGEPIAYLTGFREFHGLDLAITPDVLIPRPETEELVAAALEQLPVAEVRRLLDLGTGSGAIALAIAKERPMALIEAVDVSPAAVALAQRNARAHGAANMTVQVADWYSACVGRYDVIVSNPPYIRADDVHLGLGDLRFEPRGALTPGPVGFEAIRSVIAGSRTHLNPGGWLMLEHGFDQSAQCRQMMVGAGLIQVTSRRDLAGIERVTCGRALPGGSAG